MKKVYTTPEMTDLGEIMDLTKGVGGWGLHDFLRLSLWGDNDPDTHPFSSDPLSAS